MPRRSARLSKAPLTVTMATPPRVPRRKKRPTRAQLAAAKKAETHARIRALLAEFDVEGECEPF